MKLRFERLDQTHWGKGMASLRVGDEDKGRHWNGFGWQGPMSIFDSSMILALPISSWSFAIFYSSIP